MPHKLPLNPNLLLAASTEQGVQIIHFQNGDSIHLIRSKDCTVFKILAKPRIEGASPTHIASIVFNDAFPALNPTHLQAIVDFISDNSPLQH